MNVALQLCECELVCVCEIERVKERVGVCVRVCVRACVFAFAFVVTDLAIVYSHPMNIKYCVCPKRAEFMLFLQSNSFYDCVVTDQIRTAGSHDSVYRHQLPLLVVNYGFRG